MRRYELMMIMQPDVAEDRSKAILERTVRSITEAGGSILKNVPWGRRRLAYEIAGHRDGIYQIYLFEAPAASIAELERVLLITEEVLRHLVIRDERPASAINDELEEEAADAAAAAAAADAQLDEAESDAAPAAVAVDGE